MIDDYLEVRPEREEDLRRAARAGKISVGPWFTQMDEFLVSGESLIRNLERGLARARELAGDALPPVGYLPDQFGHVGQMPQILARHGIDRAVVWRGVPQSIDRTSFWWEAPDGSRVLTEYLAFGYSLGAHLRQAREPQELATALRNAASLLEPYSVRDGLLVTVGSDHHGPDRTLPGRLARARALAPELAPEIAPIAAYMDGPVPEGAPSRRGELRSSARAHLLPGVYSTRAHQKAERARLEAVVERYAEPLTALVPGAGEPGKEGEFDRIWQLLLWNGAHDSVCGCSVDEVARAVDARHEEARSLAESIVAKAFDRLGGAVQDAGTVRFNPSPFERDGVPGLGWRVDPDPSAIREEAIAVQEHGGRIRPDGMELWFEDEADVGDLYNFCPAGGATPILARRITVDGPVVVATFEGLEVSFLISRLEGEPFLRLEGRVSNRRPDHRLRLHVALPEETSRVVAGSPFELVERGLVSEGSDREAASPTWPARGVVLAGGLAVLAEGVFEYEVVDGRELAVTLLRCVGTISRKSLATRPWPAGPDIPTPEAQMIRETPFSLAVLPNAAREDLLPAWERFALPLRAAPARGGGSLPRSGSLLLVEGAALSSVRRRDGVLAVRVWNPSGAPVEARVADRAVPLGPFEIASIELP
jgi:alpha-mannosidase